MEETYVTQIKAVLSFFGDEFSPQEFSNAIEISPTDFWNIGAEIIRSYTHVNTKRIVVKRKESAWEYSTGFVRALYMDEVSKIVLDRFKLKLPKIKRYLDKRDLEVKMDVIVEIVNKQIPSLSISKELNLFLFELDAELDFDIYLLENE